MPEPAKTAPSTSSDASNAKQDAIALSAWQLVSLGLQVLSVRSVQLAGHLLPLFALATGFALWWRVLPDPSIYQLAGLGLYATFMLLMLISRRA